MLKLIELNPVIEDGRLIFDNPILFLSGIKERIELPIHNPPSGERVKASRHWKLSSFEFDKMSITPSVHGTFNIIDGEVRIASRTKEDKKAH